LNVETLKTGEWPASVSEFRIVVVLDNPRLGSPSPRQQREPSRGAHDCAEGELVRGGDEGEACFGGSAFAGGNVESLIVDGNGNEASAGGDERSKAAEVSRILHPRGVAG